MSDAPLLANSPFHPGEQAMQSRAGVREQLEALGTRLIRDHMPDQHRELFAKLPMVLLGSIDADGQPWASVLGRASGLISSEHNQQIEIHALPHPEDPLHANLQVGASLGMLGIEPHTRRRNRVNGVVNTVDGQGFTIAVQQSFGNCPKYIQARQVSEVLDPAGAPGTPGVVAGNVQRSTELDGAMQSLISRADTYFIASANMQPEAGTARGVDVSHRGGKPGFVRVDDASTLSAPDFIGNYFFNTLGNITAYPRAGLLFIDFDNGDLLYLAVSADIIWDADQVQQYGGAQRLMRYRVKQALRINGGLGLRWGQAQWSPVLATLGHWGQSAASA